MELPAAEMEMGVDKAPFKKITSLVLHMLRKKYIYLIDIHKKMSGRMFQVSLESRRKLNWKH